MNLPDVIYNSFEQRKAKEPKAEITFAPSYLSDCRRKIFYSKTGHEPSNPAELPGLLKMEWGNILHNDIQQRLVKAGVLESFEEWREKEYEGLKFIYRYDGMLNDGGKRAILEIKTVYASGYQTIEKAPKDEHVLQAVSYMMFEGLDKAYILYAGRDNGFLKQHEVNFCEEKVCVNFQETNLMEVWREKILDMATLEVNIQTGILPPRDYSINLKNANGVIVNNFQKDGEKLKSAWRCSYCQFYNLCWSKELEEIKTKKFYINGIFY